MICFEVHRNGARLCLAGLGEGGGLHEPEPGVQDFVDWVKLRDLAVGDEITIRIVEADEADPPADTRRTTDEEVEAAERKYYERVKAKFEGGG